MATVKSRHKNNIIYDDVEKIKAAIANATSDVKSKVGDMFNESFDSMKDQSLHLRDNISGYTAKKPFKTLSIALLAGLVIGYLIHK